jgi:hypothetical protein
MCNSCKADSFEEIPLRKNESLLPCPFCGSAAKLYDYRNFHGDHKKVVCCSNGGEFGETDECVLAMPSIAAYRDTKAEAKAIWNTRAPAKSHTQQNIDVEDAGCYND